MRDLRLFKNIVLLMALGLGPLGLAEPDFKPNRVDLLNGSVPDLLIDEAKAVGPEANDYLAYVLDGLNQASVATWRLARLNLGQGFFGSISQAEKLGAPPQGLTPVNYLVFKGGSEKSVICQNGATSKRYIFHEDTHNEGTPVGLGSSYVFEESQLNHDHFPKGDHIDRPYLAIDFAQRSVELLSLKPVEDMITNHREQLVDLVILNNIAKAQVAVIAGHNRSLKKAVRALQGVCSDDEYLRSEYEALLENPRMVDDSLAQAKRIVRLNKEIAAPKPFAFTKTDKESVEKKMFQMLGSESTDVLSAEYIISPNGAVVLPNIEMAQEAGATRWNIEKDEYLVFFGNQMSSDLRAEQMRASESKICGDKVYMLNRNAYAGQKGLDESLIMQRSWLNTSYFPNSVLDRENLFFKIDFDAHMAEYLELNFSASAVEVDFEKQRDLVILAALQDLQKALYEGDQNAAEYARATVENVCSDQAMVFLEARNLVEDEERVQRPLFAINERLASLSENDFKPVKFTSKSAEEVRALMQMAVENPMQPISDNSAQPEPEAYEPIMTRYYPTPGGGTSVFDNIGRAAQAVQSAPLAITPRDYFVFFGRNMLGAQSEDEQKAADKSLICSDKVYLIEEDGFKDEAALDRLVIMERSWLDDAYFPEKLGERSQGAFLSYDFMTRANRYLALKPYDEMNEQEKQDLVDLAIVNALYRIQEASYLSNKEQTLEYQQVLMNVCDDEKMQEEQRNMLAGDRKRVVAPRENIQREMARFRDSEYTYFDFAEIDELKKLGVMGVPVAARYAKFVEKSLRAHFFIHIDTSDMNLYSDGFERKGDGVNRFPLLVVNGVADDSEVCDFGYTYLLVPGVSAAAPQLFTLAAVPTEELNLEAETFEEMMGVEPGTGISYEEMARPMAQGLVGKVFEARDKGVISFEDPEEDNDLRAGMFVNMLVNLYASTFETVAEEEPSEEFIAGMKAQVGRLCSEESERQIRIASLRSLPETPEEIRARYADELTGDEVPVGSPDWAPPVVKLTDPYQIPIAVAWRDLLPNSVAAAWVATINGENLELIRPGQEVPEGARVFDVPVLAYDASLDNGEMCTTDYVFFVVPGIQPAPLFLVAVEKKSDVDLSADNLFDALKLEEGKTHTLQSTSASLQNLIRYPFEARDRGITRFADAKEKQDGLVASTLANTFSALYAAFPTESETTPEQIEKFRSQVKVSLNIMCGVEEKEYMVVNLGTLPPQTPAEIRALYADELTGDEVPIPSSSPASGASDSFDMGETGPGPANPGAFPIGRPVSEPGAGAKPQPNTDVVFKSSPMAQDLAGAFGDGFVKAMAVDLDVQSGDIYAFSYAPAGTEKRQLPIVVIDDSKVEGMCSVGNVYFLMPGLGGNYPAFFTVSVQKKEDLNLEASTLQAMLGRPADEKLTLAELGVNLAAAEAVAFEARDKGVLRFEESDKNAQVITFMVASGMGDFYQQTFQQFSENARFSEELLTVLKDKFGRACSEGDEEYKKSLFNRLGITPENIQEQYASEMTGDEIPLNNGNGLRDLKLSSYMKLFEESAVFSAAVNIGADGIAYFVSAVPEGVRSLPFEFIAVDDSVDSSLMCKTGHSYLVAPKLGGGHVLLGVLPNGIDVNSPEQSIMDMLGLENKDYSAQDLAAYSTELFGLVFEARDKNVTSFEDPKKQKQFLAALTAYIVTNIERGNGDGFASKPVTANQKRDYINNLNAFCGPDAEEAIRFVFETLKFSPTPKAFLDKYRDELPEDWKPIEVPSPEALQDGDQL